ncbi:MAG TPA: sterol desaturase family protein [Candidatus Binatia bacterium]|jgi:sterol desaturase/sphingolipid hydroxylase (fatty acid hydroxylase superfamily)
MLGMLLALLASGTRLRVAEAIGLGALERWRPAVPGQRILRRGVALDVAFSYLVPVIIYPAMYGVLLLLRGAQGIRGPLGQLDFAAQVVLAVIVGDVVAYWKHRLLHTRLLWPFHAAHHSSVEVDWWSNERVHPVESAINATTQAVTLVLLGFAPAAIGLAVATRQTYSAFTHANVRLSFGRLGWLFVSPHQHRWHHSDEPAMAARNFANMFAVLDVLGGTWTVPEAQPQSFGIRGRTVAKGFIGQLVAPFMDIVTRRAQSIVPVTPAVPDDAASDLQEAGGLRPAAE